MSRSNPTRYARVHYDHVAGIIRDTTLTARGRADLVARFADAFEADSPRFDRGRFIEAAWPDLDLVTALDVPARLRDHATAA